MRARRTTPLSLAHARILSAAETSRCLDSGLLQTLEQSFREWARSSLSPGVGMSRRRILLIYLLIRYTGARLNEVLKLDTRRDIDRRTRSVLFRKAGCEASAPGRRVQIPEVLSAEIQTTLDSAAAAENRGGFFDIDPGHVRRKFYERAAACGLPRAMGAPEVIRRSRAVELLQGNVPLPVVQKILGHSTPSLAAGYVSFSEEEMQRVEAFFVERENRRRTSARNAFFGKVENVVRGDVQSRVEIATPGGSRIRAVITNGSLERLGLKQGSLVAAEVKAPWVTVYRGTDDPGSSADNVLAATVERIARGKVTSEIVARIADGTEICAIVTDESRKALGLRPGDPVRVAFNAFTVVLHSD